MTNNNEPNHGQPIGHELGASLESTGAEWRNWLVTGGIAAILILAVILYRSNNANNEEKASRMLGEARNSQALQSILTQYPNTSATKLALLQLAKAQYDNSDFVAAQSNYQEFLSKYPDHPMAAMAELGKIHCTEGLGNTEVALTAFTQFAAKHPQHFLMPMAIFGKARCLQDLKRYVEARATYEDFLASNPKSPWLNDVNEALKQLDSEARRPSIKL
ncbi:MAG: tetratricopeptide repeat protein [bacterium]|jgi:outer membrane protein assembly factor BamD (BamD/ComL family)